MNRDSNKATPSCAFSIRIDKDLYETLHQRSIETGESKNKILDMALRRYLEEQKIA